MAYATIDKGSNYFNTVLYAGASGTQAVTGVGFKPDFVWIKNRSITADHQNYDIIRGTGTGGPLSVDSDDKQGFGTTVGSPAQYGYLSAFGSDGFTVVAGSVGGNFVNSSGNNFASWNWLAANSTTSNTNGSITSTVSANQTAGFSIITYTGTGSAATVGHGLGVAPSMILLKIRSAVDAWIVYSKSLGNTKIMVLNSTAAVNTRADWNNTSPTSSVFSIGTFSNENTNAATYVAYCFAEVKGYSKFGSYTGNGSADGTFIYTGFKPAFLIVKESSSAGNNWQIGDNKRNGYNVIAPRLEASTSASEYTNLSWVDFVSNGFKIRSSDGAFNTSSNTYIYMAFAENPFVLTDGTPVTAR
ncbi:hypothetical protein EB118_09880 [bacterium]|nr:hypothetical protein [bacterium]